MGGPTNTQPRYRPPPPGTAPPPPPPPSSSSEGAVIMGGQQQPQPQQQFGHSQQQSYYAQQQHQAQQQQQQPQQQSYYAQQQQQQQPSQPSRTSIPGSNQSYAARSAAAYSPHGSQHSATSGSGGGGTPTNINNNNTGANAATMSNNNSIHSSNNGNSNTNPNTPTNNTHKPKPTPESSTHHTAEQTHLLHTATQKITEYSYAMQRSMENNDVCSTLEKACLLLEELGDPNHGLHHHRSGGGMGNRGGVGAAGYAGGGAGGYAGAVGGVPPPPSYYSGASGGVPPLGNYGDRPYSYGAPPSGGSGGGQQNHQHGWITPLTPKNYYELHMRAMDEMPSLEEYLLGLCHVPYAAAAAVNKSGGGGSVGGPTNSGPTNYSSNNNNGQQQHQHQQLLAAPYPPSILYETVQYCPRVVPRLYLQICMGAVSIRAGSTPAVVVMEELGEAAKCVQCPVRGLFLRYYLLMALKDKLPDGSLDDDESEGGEGQEEVEVEEGAMILSPLTPVSAGEEILGVGSSTTTGPTSPPPALPPPPPPSTANSALFPETMDTIGGDNVPLFADSPLGEEPKKVVHPPTATTPITSPSTALSKSNTSKKATAGAPPNPNGTVVDSYNFILSNLLEMNRLWIRIQHLPGDAKTKELKRRRDRERNDLRILVGSNLNRLSQLEGISAHDYGSNILPRILEEVATCRDPLSQAYLMDCIIQVFPDEYHLETLEIFLGVCPKLREKVNVRTILSNMMERLLHYYSQDTIGEYDDNDTNNVKNMMAMSSFDMFEACVGRVYEARGVNIPPKDVVRLQGCLLNYALKISNNNNNDNTNNQSINSSNTTTTELIGRCIRQCANALQTLQESKRNSMMGQGIVLGGGTKKSMEIDMCSVATSELEKLLSVPLDRMALRDVLDMAEFGLLLSFLPWENRRKVGVSMVKSVIGSGSSEGGKRQVNNVNELEQLFTILAPLLREEGMAAPPLGMYDSNEHAAATGGGSLISRTANLMGTLGISPSAMDHDELFGGGGGNNNHNIMTMDFDQKSHSFGGDATKLAQFREEQSLVAKLIHVLDHEDTDVAYQMLNVARRHVQSGGGRARVTVTLPAVVFAALGLLRRVQVLEFPEPVIVPSAPVPAEAAAASDTGESQEEELKEEEQVAEGEAKDDTAEEDDATTAEAKEELKREETIAAADEGKDEEDSPASTNELLEEKEAEKDDSDAATAAASDEGVKEEKLDITATEASPIVAEEEQPKQTFPEFTKSVNCRKILVFLQKTVATLAPNNPELAFKLYLEIAVATDLLAHNTAQQTHFANSSGEFTSIAYDFMTQAFLVYEDEISESNAQIRAITTIVGSLLSCKTFEKTDYEALITKTAQYAAKLLKKPDQCRMVCLVSRLFYVGGKEDDTNAYRNPQRVLECLQRGLKIADACSMSSSSNVQLFVEILDYYVYYYDIGNPVITDKFVSGLIALINEHFDSIGVATISSAAIGETRAYYGQILDQIKRKKMKEDTKERFGLIVC